MRKERTNKKRKRIIAMMLSASLLLGGIGYNGVGVNATGEQYATATDAEESSNSGVGDCEETADNVEEAEENTNTTDSVVEVEGDAPLTNSEKDNNEEVTDEPTNIYIGEGYTITFNLDSKWDTGYIATVTIENTGETSIENWCISFPLEQKICNIWNGTISKNYGDYYVIKNSGWNQDIPAGARVTFGMAVYESFTEYPEYYTMIGKETELCADDYSVAYTVTDDWGDGYRAEITITNNKTTPLEDWRLSFDYTDNVITQIWDGIILGNENGHYEIGCETYNQNIEPGESITIGMLVEPGCSENQIENITLKEYETDMSDGQSIIVGYMDEGSNELFLNMLSSVECNKYEIYASMDGGSYTLLGELEEENSYTYTLTEIFEQMEIYAIGYDTNGLPMETNHIYVEMQDGKYVVVLPDTDGDGLSDCYEIYYGSDLTLTDTDEDGLSDYYEVYVSYTYPTMMDSDGNGINDGDEDYDKDNLTIIEECSLQTDPVNDDTDEDGLLDGEEVKIYFTEPLVADIDRDKLLDGDEITLGTEPYDEDSDDDGIFDGDEKFQQSYTHTVENDDCVIKEVTISLEGTGNLQRITEIESIMNKDILCTGVVGLIGEPFEIETESEFESATITFKLDKEKLGETEFENLMFLWFDEENYEFVELETVLDEENGTASVETTHFSKYMVVDKTVWYDAWAEEISYNSETDMIYYTVLTIDCSGSMASNDPIIKNDNINNSYDAAFNRITCNRIQGAIEFVDCMGENDKIAVVLFNSTAKTVLNFTSDKDAIKLALQNVYSYGGTNYNSALDESMDLFTEDILDNDEICTRIIFLSDGEDTCSEIFLNKAYEENIVIHGIGLGNDSDDDTLREMSKSTDGTFYKADTSDMLSKLYEQIYILDSFDKTDTDGDGLYDIIETAGIRLCNGQIIYTNPGFDDTDGDGLLDGQEVSTVPVEQKEVKILGMDVLPGGYVFEYYSDPRLIDTDGDNASDIEDYTPIVCNEYRSYLFYPLNGEWFLKREADVRWKSMTNIDGKTVQKMPTTTIDNFKDKWAAMGMIGDKIAYQIDEVHLIYHGQPRSIKIDSNERLYADTIITSILDNNYNSRGDIVIDDLESKNIYYLNLSSCNNGNIDFLSSRNISGVYDNMAVSFLKSKHNIHHVTAWDGTAMYGSIYFEVFSYGVLWEYEFSYENQNFKKWSTIINGYEREAKQRVFYWKNEQGNIEYFYFGME